MGVKARTRGVAVFATSCALVLSACAPAEYGTGVTGSLTAIGSISQNGPMSAWEQGWTKQYPQTSLRFSPDGDASGRDALIRGMAHFASIDSQLTEQDWENSKRTCGPEGAFAVPTSVTAIGVAYNVSGLKNVRLDQAALTAIFRGDVTNWNDRRIAVLNPDSQLPDLKIVPVWAKSHSGLTRAVADYLLAGDPTGGDTFSGDRDAWAAGTKGQSVSTYPDIAKRVDDQAGAIAFMDRAAIGTRFSTATLKFGDQFLKVTDDALAVAVDNAEISAAPGGGVGLTLRSGQLPGYSLGFVGYQAFCHSYKNPALVRLVKSWAEFVIGDGGQANSTYFAQVGSPSSKALERSRAAVEEIKAP